MFPLYRIRQSGLQRPVALFLGLLSHHDRLLKCFRKHFHELYPLGDPRVDPTPQQRVLHPVFPVDPQHPLSMSYGGYVIWPMLPSRIISRVV